MKSPDPKHTNHLINESSPYLLQHAHNPVNWFPWGEEALSKARQEDKLILVSIGYAACHWCHVMERESFENEIVAQIMNKHFVCIKVDREERPDIDQVYMEAVQLLTGHGGWPLNCFALPDGRPVYGGTYFPRENWISVLSSLEKLYRVQKDGLEQQAEDIRKGMVSNELFPEKIQADAYKPEELRTLYNNWKKDFDRKEGGENRAPKFPMPDNYEFLLMYAHYSNDREALEHVVLTLDKMAGGGIYDHIGGGFSRYSTDIFWKVPHFEKMLYDNAQLVSLYSAVFQKTRIPRFQQVVEETLDFIHRELTSPEGGFYASLDADSEGEEGKYYTWTKKEIDTILEEDSDLFCRYYNITAQGNWEYEKNILHVVSAVEEFAAQLGIGTEALTSLLERSRNKLIISRDQRVRPALDDKILTSWNALMLKGYADAYRVFGKKEYLELALKNADFICSAMLQPDKRLYRNYKKGRATINGFLDDYAFTINAFIVLYRATFDENWLQLAGDLTEYTLEHFYDKKAGLFYYTSQLDPQLVVRKYDISDNVIPSSNSSMARNLFALAGYFDNEEYAEIAKKMYAHVQENVICHGKFYSNWAQLLVTMVYEPHEIVIAGEKALEKLGELEKYYLPGITIAGTTTRSDFPLLENRHVPGKTYIYVCKNKVCRQPVQTVDEALEQLLVE